MGDKSLSEIFEQASKRMIDAADTAPLYGISTASNPQDPQAFDFDDDPIDPGDVVMMRSGSGPALTVDKITAANVVRCSWFDTYHNLVQADINSKILVIR